MFTCQCERCLDPTEFGTFYGGLKCELCSDSGICVPTDGNDFEADWACSGCQGRFPGKELLEQLKYLNENIEQALEDSRGSVKTFDFVSFRDIH